MNGLSTDAQRLPSPSAWAHPPRSRSDYGRTSRSAERASSDKQLLTRHRRPPAFAQISSMAGGRRQSAARHAPLPFDRSLNEPVRVYPPEAGRSSVLTAFQALQAKPAAVVGLLSSSASSSSQALALANRIVGRCVFRDDEVQSAATVKDARLPASIHLFYDDDARVIYLLGLARPESLCFAEAKGRSRGAAARRQSMAEEEQDELTESQRVRAELDAFEHEKLKMQVLLYSSCHMLIVLREDARVPNTVLRVVRALTAEKTQLMSFVASSGKHPKRDGHSKGATASGNAFAPGRCVPLVLYVVPAPDEVIYGSLKVQGAAGPSRSATVAFCKTIEARLTALFRSLRGGTVGSVRMRDALSAANLSKEKRLFNLDPAHGVVVVSRRTATADGRVETQLEDLLDALDLDITADDILEDDSLLEPLGEDDIGLQRIQQYLRKYLDLLFTASGAGNSKDTRPELLAPPQWLKSFHSLAKNYQRLETRRRQDAAVDTSSNEGFSEYLAPATLASYQFDPMELTR